MTGTESHHKGHAPNALRTAMGATPKMYPQVNANGVFMGAILRHKRRASKTAHVSIVATTTAPRQKLGHVAGSMGILIFW